MLQATRVLNGLAGTGAGHGDAVNDWMTLDTGMSDVLEEKRVLLGGIVLIHEMFMKVDDRDMLESIRLHETMAIVLCTCFLVQLRATCLVWEGGMQGMWHARNVFPALVAAQ